MMNKELLEYLGWTVECESPLEIRHEDGSFASGYAAGVLIDHLEEEHGDDFNKKLELKKIIDTYTWIKVKQFNPDIYVSDYEVLYKALNKHHKKETEFLIDKCRELAGELLNRM